MIAITDAEDEYEDKEKEEEEEEVNPDPTEEPKYLCAYCDRSFYYEMPMQIHMLQHDKEKLEEEKAARAAAGTGTGNDLFSRISSSYQRFNQFEISHFPS